MAERYGIYFKYGDRAICLPVNPAKLPEEREGNNDDYNVLGIGPIVIPRTPRLRKVKISSYFPAVVNGFVFSPERFLPPAEYIAFFRAAMMEKRVLTYVPVRYNEAGVAFNTSDDVFPCIVSSFNTEERGGETGDFYYDLTITEWRDYTPQTVKIDDGFVMEIPTRSTDPEVIVRGEEVIVSGPVYAPGTNVQTGTANGWSAVVERYSEARTSELGFDSWIVKIDGSVFDKSYTSYGRRAAEVAAGSIEKAKTADPSKLQKRAAAVEEDKSTREEYGTTGDFYYAMLTSGWVIG